MFGAGVAQKQNADAEQDQHDADLERSEHAGHGVGHALAGSKFTGMGAASRKRLPASVSMYDGEFLVGAELVDEPAVHLALQLEDAAPAAVLEERADHPDEGDKEAGEGQQGRDRHEDIGIVRGIRLARTIPARRRARGPRRAPRLRDSNARRGRTRGCGRPQDGW